MTDRHTDTRGGGGKRKPKVPAAGAGRSPVPHENTVESLPLTWAGCGEVDPGFGWGQRKGIPSYVSRESHLAVTVLG